MNSLVKEFIEETIRYIETGEYHEVFTIRSDIITGPFRIKRKQ